MIQKSTAETPLEEIHRIRREISDRFGGDIAAIAADADFRRWKSSKSFWISVICSTPKIELQKMIYSL